MDARSKIRLVREFLRKTYEKNPNDAALLEILEQFNDQLNMWDAQIRFAGLMRVASVLNEMSEHLERLTGELQGKIDNFLIDDLAGIQILLGEELGQQETVSTINSNAEKILENNSPPIQDDHDANIIMPEQSNFPNAAEILKIAESRLGRPYEHPSVDLEDSDWPNGYDCAEYASWCAYQAYGIAYGTRPKGTSENTNAYTGYWKNDAQNRGIMISVSEALNTPGAFLLRYPPQPGTMGHIAISVGNGEEVFEAHSKKRGVIKNIGKGRNWHTGVKIPGVAYENDPEPIAGVYVYKDGNGERNDVVLAIQEALIHQGYLSIGHSTAIFDRQTETAVIQFQQKNGLVVDGEVGPNTGRALGLGHLWGDAPSLKFETSGIAVETQPIAWGGFVDKKFGSSKFKEKVIAIATRLNTDPNFLMAAMAFETGREFQADTKNPTSGATGLIQFMPKTANWLGTSTEALAQMSEIDQLDFVEKYLRSMSHGKKLATLSDVYMTILWPKAVGKPESYVLFRHPSNTYKQNKGLDVSKDGLITKAEAASKVEKQLVDGTKMENLG